MRFDGADAGFEIAKRRPGGLLGINAQLVGAAHQPKEFGSDSLGRFR